MALIILHILGYSCDSCQVEDFSGLRYCCEICDDYHLCGTCFDHGKESLEHLKSHSMKCIPLLSIPQVSYTVTNLSMSCDEKYKERLNETEYLSILLDYCLQRFISDATYCQHINTIHFKERFADALNWKNDFIAKLSGSRLTGLVEQYFVESDDDRKANN